VHVRAAPPQPHEVHALEHILHGLLAAADRSFDRERGGGGLGVVRKEYEQRV
jgi:hypothetical protein